MERSLGGPDQRSVFSVRILTLINAMLKDKLQCTTWRRSVSKGKLIQAEPSDYLLMISQPGASFESSKTHNT